MLLKLKCNDLFFEHEFLTYQLFQLSQGLLSLGTHLLTIYHFFSWISFCTVQPQLKTYYFTVILPTSLNLAPFSSIISVNSNPVPIHVLKRTPIIIRKAESLHTTPVPTIINSNPDSPNFLKILKEDLYHKSFQCILHQFLMFPNSSQNLLPTIIYSFLAILIFILSPTTSFFFLIFSCW